MDRNDRNDRNDNNNQEGISVLLASPIYYLIRCGYLLESVTIGISISSIEMPPCWKVSRKYCT